MTPELKAAAERQRQMVRDSNQHDGGYPATPEGRALALGDAVTLADAWIADNLPDDELPVDEDWLRSINWAAVGQHWYSNSERMDADEPIVIWHARDRSVKIAGLGLWKISNCTRGQFRRLASALGLSLEPKE